MTHTHDDEYFNMLKEILVEEDTIKENRTATKTIGIIGHKAVYSLEDGYYNDDGDLVIPNFPLLTTKKVFFKGIVAELFWLINGHTNIRFLERNKVRIWSEWPHTHYTKHNPDDPLTLEEFQNKIATNDDFAARWGDLGPVYGKQWRCWEKAVNHTIEHVDQFMKANDTLAKSPASRRNIVSAWNAGDIEDMEKSGGLPPCHSLFQLLTTPDRDADEDSYILDLVMYQRSLDTFLGGPFNIASYSLLLGIFAEHHGMLPGKFTHMIGDCHLYVNHIEQAKEQMERVPYEGPTVTIKQGLMKKLMELPVNYYDLNYEELAEYIVLENYRSHATIQGDVAV